MIQLLQVIVSILWGFIYGFIYDNLLNKQLYIAIVTTIMTIAYIAIMYYLNYGIISYILKINLIFGFFLYKKVSKLLKKV